jgi:hypothetical protein
MACLLPHQPASMLLACSTYIGGLPLRLWPASTALSYALSSSLSSSSSLSVPCLYVYLYVTGIFFTFKNIYPFLLVPSSLMLI